MRVRVPCFGFKVEHWRVSATRGWGLGVGGWGLGFGVWGLGLKVWTCLDSRKENTRRHEGGKQMLLYKRVLRMQHKGNCIAICATRATDRHAIHAAPSAFYSNTTAKYSSGRKGRRRVESFRGRSSWILIRFVMHAHKIQAGNSRHENARHGMWDKRQGVLTLNPQPQTLSPKSQILKIY